VPAAYSSAPRTARNGRLLHGSQTLPGVGLPIIRRRVRTAHAGPRFAAWTVYAFPTECNGTQLSSAEPKEQNSRRRRVEYSQGAFVVRKGPNGRPCSEVCTESFVLRTLGLSLESR
jgi:hypothetical protein